MKFSTNFNKYAFQSWADGKLNPDSESSECSNYEEGHK